MCLAQGFPTIEAALLGDLSFGLLLVLILLKPLATSLTLGSGNSGGVFAPALLTGAVLGGAFGQAVEYFAPGMTAGPGRLPWWAWLPYLPGPHVRPSPRFSSSSS